MATFLEKITELMNSRGLTQIDLEREAKLAKGRISRWVNGHGQPTLAQGLAIARALGVPLESLADPAAAWPPPQRLTGEDEWIIEAARNMGYEKAKGRLLLTSSDDARFGAAEIDEPVQKPDSTNPRRRVDKHRPPGE